MKPGSFCDYRIEDNIPLPVRDNHRDKYPWNFLQLGQSFLVDLKPGQTHQRLSNSLTSCRALAERKTGFKFTMQWVGKGIRVWRSR